ncbi:peptidoglycan-binding domain-containing protein [Actinomadura madurae]|nr:peptidoglycan-binding domain-containing protein [Actinomadura madurae]MCP9947294.1 peptidoglycan-binding protein [Actinomadura madurae]MCQ0012727.1 peptidoglycan-binding protein [Actinomadura madurae]
MVKKLPMLSKGDTGEHVQSLQGLLQARSHPEVHITGKFDAATEKAVRAVQRWGGVDDDGVVGPMTWPVMLRVHD